MFKKKKLTLEEFLIKYPIPITHSLITVEEVQANMFPWYYIPKFSKKRGSGLLRKELIEYFPYLYDMFDAMPGWDGEDCAIAVQNAFSKLGRKPKPWTAIDGLFMFSSEEDVVIFSMSFNSYD